MASDDDRREVAQKLRRLAERHDAVAWFLICMYLGLEEDDRFFSGSLYTSESVMRLADLIEPAPEHTCRIVVSIDRNPASYGGRVHRCSSCRKALPKALVRHGWRINYCPKCGARITEVIRDVD